MTRLPASWITEKGTDTVTPTGVTDNLLLENGDDLLLENGDDLLLESSIVTPKALTEWDEA